LLSAIHDLIAQVSDQRLRERLAAEWASASKEKKFGLVFEDHLPELLPLYNATPRRGDLVCRRDSSLKHVWQVQQIRDGIATCVKPGNDVRPSSPHSTEAGAGAGAAREIFQWSLDELLVVREFGEPIFPSLVPVDTVRNGSADAPWHTLIEADNYHALQLLEYLYAEQVDCIYIDPPYNTGARDWKYNNDYVDGNDGWRHSKWLAFMEKRLKLAKRLLKPDTGVLIVTIDEHEVHHLAMLLEREFPEAYRQMVSYRDQSSQGGARKAFGAKPRSTRFFFMPAVTRHHDDCCRPMGDSQRPHKPRKGAGSAARQAPIPGKGRSPGLFYPIYIDPTGPTIAQVGSPLAAGVSVPEQLPGLVALLPIRKNRTEGNWQWYPETLRERMKQGRVRIGGNASRGFVIYILKDGEYAKIQRGEFEEAGRADDGSIIVEDNDASYVRAVPGSQWRIATHDATQYGSRMLGDVLPDRRFPFPKSLYAVRDTLRFFVETKPEALVLDFFAGSGRRSCRQSTQRHRWWPAPLHPGHQQRGFRRGGRNPARSRLAARRPGLGSTRHLPLGDLAAQ
jgi:adenine-specific DNA-methyltransferase